MRGPLVEVVGNDDRTYVSGAFDRWTSADLIMQHRRQVCSGAGEDWRRVEAVGSECFQSDKRTGHGRLAQRTNVEPLAVSDIRGLFDT